MIIPDPQEPQDEPEDPPISTNIREQSVRKFFDNCAQEGGEFRPIDITVKVPESEGFSWAKLFSFVGPALFVSVGYLDPGNWATDVAGGSEFGYTLLWVLLFSNMMALTLQILASRIGVVTRRDLAQLCRQEYPSLICRVLWLICEIAIAATDLAEVLGTAIGLQMLFHLPLIFGVILTALDTLIFLVVQKYGIRKLEFFILILLGIIASCFIVELFLVAPPFVEVIKGFIPTINTKSVYSAVGILGATVMPHNFFLHSSIVQSREIKRTHSGIKQSLLYNFWDTFISLNFAFFVNASILIVASAVFFARGRIVTELQEAHDLLEGLLKSNVAPVVFGLGLFCAGQSSTLTGTMAGQIVMEGFVDLKMVPWIRRLLTRLLAIVPAVITIAIAGSEGTYQLLVLSQVILSFALPFAVIPLVQFSSCPTLMGPFASPVWLKVLAWIFAIFVVALNVWAVGDILVAFMKSSTAALVCTIIFIFPLCIALMALLVYVSFIWKKKDVNNQFTFEQFNDDIALEDTSPKAALIPVSQEYSIVENEDDDTNSFTIN